jgi:hypothetical protein
MVPQSAPALAVCQSHLLQHACARQLNLLASPLLFAACPCPPGCILGELLCGKPIFPGTSTMNQLDRIMEVTGRPGPEDLEAISSPFAATMMESCSVTHAKKLSELFPGASPEACDLLMKLLHVSGA